MRSGRATSPKGVVIAFLLAAALIGCGDDDSAPTAPGTTATGSEYHRSTFSCDIAYSASPAALSA